MNVHLGMRCGVRSCDVVRIIVWVLLSRRSSVAYFMSRLPSSAKRSISIQ